MDSQMYFAWPAFLTGLSIAAGLIISIGPQNAFVLRQGIARKHVIPIVALCIAFDIFLISVGVIGFDAFALQWPTLIKIAAWGGTAFLALYALQSFKAAIRPSLLGPDGSVECKLQGAILTTVVLTFTVILTFLNPCVYLDTVVFLGGISSQFAPNARFAYWLGCIIVSVVWFTLLGLFAGWLAPLFYRPISWRVLNGIVGSTFFVAAAQLASRDW